MKKALVTIDLLGTASFEVEYEDDEMLQEIIDELKSTQESDYAQLLQEDIGPDGNYSVTLGDDMDDET